MFERLKKNTSRELINPSNIMFKKNEAKILEM
jgi:hypothetical protein